MIFIIFFFFFNDTATTEIYTLSLHDALPICHEPEVPLLLPEGRDLVLREPGRDRKSTRLNSSHDQISYAVFCLKKKKKINSKRDLQDSIIMIYIVVGTALQTVDGIYTSHITS